MKKKVINIISEYPNFTNKYQTFFFKKKPSLPLFFFISLFCWLIHTKKIYRPYNPPQKSSFTYHLFYDKNKTYYHYCDTSVRKNYGKIYSMQYTKSQKSTYLLITHSCIRSPSQSAPIISVLRTWVDLQPLKK